MLHRLDKRCDRAAELGANHLALVCRWDEWLALVGKGEEQAARALLNPRGTVNLVNFPLARILSSCDSEDEDIDLTERCWKDEIDNVWLTDFPPPAGFAGYESRPWDEDDDDAERYERECTPEEAALLDANSATDDEDDDRADDEALRDALFAQLKAELPSADEQSLPLDGGG